MNKKSNLIGAEHCFKIPENWYRLNIGYTNPYNIHTPHAELSLIEDLKGKNLAYNNNLYSLFKEKRLVFYGIGVGDTEIAFVDWVLKKGQELVDIWGVDINSEFLDNFSVGIKNLILEYPGTAISYSDKRGLFDEVHMHPLDPAAYICLGGTIGNFYNQHKLFNLFKTNAKEGDSLILGFQEDTYIDLLFDKYRNNPLFDKFVTSSIGNDVELRWKKEKMTILAYVDGKVVFQSKKYNPSKLEKELLKHSFKIKETCEDKYKNICLQFYERK
jgi:hypothetical protein